MESTLRTKIRSVLKNFFLLILWLRRLKQLHAGKPSLPHEVTLCLPTSQQKPIFDDFLGSELYPRFIEHWKQLSFPPYAVQLALDFSSCDVCGSTGSFRLSGFVVLFLWHFENYWIFQQSPFRDVLSPFQLQTLPVHLACYSDCFSETFWNGPATQVLWQLKPDWFESSRTHSPYHDRGLFWKLWQQWADCWLKANQNLVRDIFSRSFT